MPTNHEFVAVALLLVCAFAVMSVVLAGLSAMLQPLTKSWSARVRLRVTVLLLISPVILATALALLAAAPHLWASIAEHCALHAADHGCGWHLPIEGTGTSGNLLVAVIAVVALFGLLKFANVIQQHRLLQRLLAVANFDASLGTYRLPIKAPMAFTAGILHPRTYLSDGLLDELTAQQTQQVLAHERAHATRRDGLFKLALSVLSIGHWPAVRKRLFRDWELASEQRCDAAVAKTPQQATELADCLLRVARLSLAHQPFGPSVCRLDGGHLEQRIWALLGPAEQPSWRGYAGLAFAVTVALASVAGFAPLIHRLLEQLA